MFWKSISIDRLGFKDIKRAEPELAHPIGFVLDIGDLVDDLTVESLLCLEDAGRLGAKIVLVDFADFVFRFGGCVG